MISHGIPSMEMGHAVIFQKRKLHIQQTTPVERLATWWYVSDHSEMASVSRNTLTIIFLRKTIDFSGTGFSSQIWIPTYDQLSCSPPGEEETSHEVKRPSFLNVPTLAAPEKHVKIGAVEVAPKTLTPWSWMAQIMVFPVGIYIPSGKLNIQKAIENGHRNSGFSHEKWVDFP